MARPTRARCRSKVAQLSLKVFKDVRELDEFQKVVSHVDELHSIGGNGAGVSAQGTGCPSKPLKGTLLSACDMRWIVPSASPNAIYAALGEIAAQVK